jgi:hypothetical protein
MHSYDGFWPWEQCDEPDWPTSQDITSVENLIPVRGTQQGGSATPGGGKAFGG